MKTTLVVIREQVIDPSQNFPRTNKDLLVDWLQTSTLQKIHVNCNDKEGWDLQEPFFVGQVQESC